MRYRELGQSGLQVSVVGLGTWAIGGTLWGGTEETSALAAIRRSLESGVTLIDTAPLYGFGLAEELIARALVGQNRQDVVIADKVGLTWQGTAGKPYMEIAGKTVYKNLRPASVRAEVEGCLRRLGTDYIDILFTNAPDPTTPIAETMEELLRLKAAGAIRAIGVSNVTLAQLHEYLALGQVDAVQQQYHMLDRRLERDLLPFCREQNIAVFAYSALAQGLLTRTLIPQQQFPAGDMRVRNPRFSADSIARINVMLDRFVDIRKQYSLDQTQLTIAWTISHPGITSALVGARNAEQAVDNAGGGIELAPSDMERMDRILDEWEEEKRHRPAA